MERIIKAEALVLSNNIDTDQIYPGRYLDLVEPADAGMHCLEGVDPQIPKTFVKGNIIVAGKNFGCGSSREHAPISLINMGASCVVAESFARIFFRNGINLGLPLITCKGISERVKTGDTLEVDVTEGVIRNITTGEELKGDPLSEYIMGILSAGGIKEVFRQKYAQQK